MPRTAPDAPRRTRRTERQWRSLIRAQARSRQSRKAFCARHGVALSTFDWWRRRLREEEFAGEASDPVAAESPTLIAPTFVELTRPPSGTPATIPVSEATGVWEIELDLGAGLRLRLRRAPC